MHHLLKFNISHLLYDIGNNAYIVGHKIETETGDPVKAHQITDICATGNIDRVRRVLDQAHALVVEMLRPYTLHRDNIRHLFENAPWIPKEYCVNIRSEQISATTLNLLARAIHEYMVCYVLYDWLSIVYAAEAPPWAEKRALAAAEISQCLHSCFGGCLKRRTAPF